MSENSKWTRFLPDKLEKWLTGDAPDTAPGVEYTPGPAQGDDPLLSYAPPGVEWTPGGDDTLASCPVCGEAYPVDADPAAPCPSCGADRPDQGLPAGVDDSPTRVRVPVLDPDAAFQPRRPCAACGGEVDIDGYCMTCGEKATSERDHFREEPARWLAGVCDRGIRHHRNEDAMALAASQEPGERGVLVVCDGVSTSIDSDVASLAAAQAARDVLWANQPKGVGTEESRSAAMTQALVESARVANEAVVERTALDSDNAASATFAAAVVSDGLVFYANLGDSRVYWLPDEGEDRQLSVDDSVAQARIEAGIPREEAENGEGAHSITKWLGRDAADVVPRVGVLQPTTEGWVVVCSDGLWNYASLPDQIRDVLDEALAADPQPSSLVDVTERMVAWANGMGGRDNITVALARLGGLAMLAETDAPSVTTPVPVAPPAAAAAPQTEPVEFEQPAWSLPDDSSAPSALGTAQTPSGTVPAAEAPEVGIPPRPAPATPAPSAATAPYVEGPAPAVPPGPATTPPPGIVVPNPAD